MENDTVSRSITSSLPVLISTLPLSLLLSQDSSSISITTEATKTITIYSHVYEQRFEEFSEILLQINVIKYDRDGNMIDSSLYNSDGEPSQDHRGISKYRIKYDSSGNRIQWSSYDSKGSLISKSVYKYDHD